MRKSNYEWLRILAMGMIITLHYFYKGGIARNFAEDASAVNVVCNIICSLCICAVNTYILISGYFLVEAPFKSGRLFGLLVQVLEYSILVSAVMIVTGGIKLSELTVYDILGYLIPIGTEEYWFITAYFFMYLLSPILGQGLKALDEKTHRLVLIILVIFTCLEKTIIPIWLATDRYGYDLLWFVTLYITAAYIRLYGIRWLEERPSRAWIIYFGSVLLIFVTAFACGRISAATGSDIVFHYADITTHYNFIWVYTASIGLFYLFHRAVFNEEGIAARIARWTGHLTLGVYLLHEHPMIRQKWQLWLGVDSSAPIYRVLAGWLVSLIIVYGAGILVEYVRTLIHSRLSKDMKKGSK